MIDKRLMASALSALLVATSTPIPAMAEELSTEPAAVVQQAAAGDVQNDAADAQAEPAADEGEEAPAADAAVEANVDGDAPAADGLTDDADAEAMATVAATAATTAATTGAAQVERAAGDSYETEAPAHDAATFAALTGAVSYRMGSGSSNSTAIGLVANIASVGEPTKNAKGGWDVVVTLSSKATASDFGLAAWQVDGADPKATYIDAGASKLTITFSTDSATDGSWSTFGTARASLVFTKQAPAAPSVAFDLDDVLDADNAVHYYANGTTKHATSVTKADNVASVGEPVRHDSGVVKYWSVDVTLKGTGSTAADYGVPTGYLGGTDPSEWVLDESADNDLTTTFALYDGQSAWKAATGSYALLHFVRRAPEPAAPSAADVAQIQGALNCKLLNEDGSEAYSTRVAIPADAVKSIGAVYQTEDNAYAVDVTLEAKATPDDYGIDVPAFYGDGYVLNEDASTLHITLRYEDGAWTYEYPDIANLVFELPAKPQAPAFDIENELNVYGTLTYTVNRADGTSYENGGHLGTADAIESVGQPYQTEDGCWAVDVTLKSSVEAGDFAPSWALGDGTYVLDADASKLTLTFRTLTPEGTTWYCSAGDRAHVVFTEQTDEGGETPGGDTEQPGGDTEQPGGDTETPGEDTEQPGKTPADETVDDKAPDKDAQASSDAKQDAGLPQTSDPMSLAGVASAALAGVSALLAGLGIARRRDEE